MTARVPQFSLYVDYYYRIFLVTRTPLISVLMPCPAVPLVLVEMFGMCVVGRRAACAGLTVLILSFSLIPGVCWHFHIFSIPIITVYTTEILFGCFNYKKSDYSDLPNYLFESAVISVTAVAVWPVHLHPLSVVCIVRFSPFQQNSRSDTLHFVITSFKIKAQTNDCFCESLRTLQLPWARIVGFFKYILILITAPLIFCTMC